MEPANTSTCTTDGITVTVNANPAPVELVPSELSSCYAYHVTITNHGDSSIRILRRHWEVIDGDGQVEVIEGPGILGKIPTIAAGDTFRYTSYCPLATDWGTMEGNYLIDRGGVSSRIDIARFHLFPSGEPSVEPTTP